MKQEELDKILELHKLWLNAKEDGAKANLREADLEGANLREADLTRADLTGANLREADLEGANLREADLTGANLTRADLEGANLRGDGLYGANLTRANLREANLTRADLRGADLEGANLYNTQVVAFQLGKNFGFAHFGEQYEGGSLVKIGCHKHSLEYWLEQGEIIGKEEGYTEKEIKLYIGVLNHIRENQS